MRSLLFVPADNERKIARAQDSGADVLIFDLEDSVAPDRKSAAREALGEFLASMPEKRSWQAYVRINPLGTLGALKDILASARPGVAGIVLPKAVGQDDLTKCSHYIDMAELSQSLEPGSLALLPVITETPKAVLSLAKLAPTPRLAAVTWGGEDLASEIGALGNKLPSGEWDDCFRLARTMTLLAAATCEVPAIDTLHVNYRDQEGLEASCRSARFSGFGGKIAIHPDQVPTINACFTPQEAEIVQAREIVDAFAASTAGTIGLNGKMLDRPHLIAAERVLRSIESEQSEAATS